MSGGVDSSMAAALLLEQGHDVVGATMRLWDGGPDAPGCCSVAEVDDARRVAQQLGIDHWVFNFMDDFEERVVAPYVAGHAAGETPNPCIECNRHVKFARFLRRAIQLGFDGIATGHHARVDADGTGRHRLRRGTDAAKDQSYVLHVLGQTELTRCRFPVGALTKAEVRRQAAALELRTAAKPDSQEVCFVTAAGGRDVLLRERIPLRAGQVVDTAGSVVGGVDAVELVTVGQRRGLGVASGRRRYALAVDVATATVTIGGEDELLVDEVVLRDMTWVDAPVAGPVLAQCSAHAPAERATFDGAVVRFAAPRRRVAPGQSVVLYDETDDYVLGGGVALSPSLASLRSGEL